MHNYSSQNIFHMLDNACKGYIVCITLDNCIYLKFCTTFSKNIFFAYYAIIIVHEIVLCHARVFLKNLFCVENRYYTHFIMDPPN